MNYTDFCNKIFSAIREYLGEEAEVSLDKITKNNGTIMYGLIIRTAKAKISPTLYLEHFYDDYMKNGDFASVFSELVSIYENNTNVEIDMEYFTDYEQVKEHVIMKLINYDMNRELLKDVPHVRWNDLAIVFCHVITDPQIGFATILIRNDHVNLWGIDDRTLYYDASISTPQLMPERLESMEEILQEIMCDCVDVEQREELLAQMKMPESCDMYVLSNKKRIFGAGVILYSQLVDKMAKQYGCGIYIIPCSIHELILVPKYKNCDATYMRQMIKDVNSKEVSIEERLSDNLYYYDPEKKEIRVFIE